MTPSITESTILTALRLFLIEVLPAGIAVVKGQVNRVPQSSGQNSVVMTPIRRERISTNVDADADAKFTASISGTTMTVTAVALGSIAVGATVFGSGVASGTTIATQIGGAPGGVGTYSLSSGVTLSSRTLSAGQTLVEQGTKFTVQVDVYGPSSGDNAQVISTLMRDPWGVDQFNAQGLGVVPLYADDPRQVPFVDENQQVEYRWVVEACLQANPVVTVPQQYADSVVPTVIEVVPQG